MQIQLLEGLSGTYEDEVTPLFAGPGEVIEVSEAWALRLIAAGYAVAVVAEPDVTKRKRVVT